MGRPSLIDKRLWLAGVVAFALLSLTDFVQTYALITRGEGTVYEANPVAGAWLERHGWSGLAAFKLGAVAVFAGAAVLLAIRRPRAGAGVLALGCLALLTVTLYSSRLIANTDRPPCAEEEIVVIDLGRVPHVAHPDSTGIAPDDGPQSRDRRGPSRRPLPDRPATVPE
jgi:hypothetical protein